MAVIIRDAAEADLGQILEIENAVFSMPFTLDMLRRQLDRKDHVFLTAMEESGEIAGYIGMQFVLDEGYISNVAVRGDCRRKGIGLRLVNTMLEKGEGLGLSFLTLEVRESNMSAQALYEKCGFKTVGTIKNYYTKPKENAHIMTHFFEKRESN